MHWLLWIIVSVGFSCISALCGIGFVAMFMWAKASLVWKKHYGTDVFRNNILRKNICPLRYTIMADFTLLMEKFDKAAVADQLKEWAKELDDEARARETLSLDAAVQLANAREFYESNVDFVNEQHAARLAALRDIPAAVSENESLADAQAELQEYVSDAARQEFMQKMRELSAMDKELHDYLLAKGLLGRAPVPEAAAETSPESDPITEAEADPTDGMPENPLAGP